MIVVVVAVVAAVVRCCSLFLPVVFVVVGENLD